MVEKIEAIISKYYKKAETLYFKYREIIVYIFFGGLTTLVSYGSFYLLEYLKVNYNLSQWISWVAAVAFAFIVNKLFVFGDHELGASGLFRQIWQFVSVRIASGVLEWLLLLLFVEVVHIVPSISKIIVSVVTVIVNYIASKLLVFRKKNNGGQSENS